MSTPGTTETEKWMVEGTSQWAQEHYGSEVAESFKSKSHLKCMFLSF